MTVCIPKKPFEKGVNIIWNICLWSWIPSVIIFILWRYTRNNNPQLISEDLGILAYFGMIWIVAWTAFVFIPFIKEKKVIKWCDRK